MLVKVLNFRSPCTSCHNARLLQKSKAKLTSLKPEFEGGKAGIWYILFQRKLNYFAAMVFPGFETLPGIPIWHSDRLIFIFSTKSGSERSISGKYFIRGFIL